LPCSAQCDEYHERYLILRNCRAAPTIAGGIAEAMEKFGSILRVWNSSLSINRIDSDALPIDTKKRRDQPEELPVAPCKTHIPADLKVAREARTPSGSEDSLERQLKAVVEKQFHVSMTSLTQYRGPGYNKDKVMEDAIAQTPVGAIWETSHPCAAALCKPWIFVAISFLTVSIATNLSIGVLFMSQNLLHHGSRVRLTALDGRSASLSSLGYLRDGCGFESRARPFAVDRSPSSLAVSYDESVLLNGWWFSVPLAAVGDAPTRFTFEVWDGGAWQRAGSSSHAWTWSGAVVFLDGALDLRSPPAGVRTRVHDGQLYAEFDMRLPWMWTHAKWISNLSLIMMTGSVSLVSLTKRQMQGRWYCAFFWTVLFVIELLSCIVYARVGESALALLCGIFALSDLIYASCLAFYESVYRHVNGVCGALYFGGVVAHYLYLDAPGMICGRYLCLENRGIMEGFGLVMLFLSALVSRAMSRRKAERVIAEFRDAYEKCWARLLASEEGLSAVKQIAKCTASIAAGLPERIRQRGRGDAQPPLPRAGSGVEPCDTALCRRQQSAGGARASSPPLQPGVAEPAAAEAQPDGPVIQDLDQLFAQAEGVDVVLRRKVREWGLASRGCFQTERAKCRVAFARWGDAAAAGAPVLWAAVKSKRRAIEKLYRSYDCDVARLLDCCRQSLYFERPRDLLACLRAIAGDAEAQVVRVKNLLEPGRDALATGGYRNVALNLQLRTAETRRLGIDAHVCELQLVTVDFARIKVPGARRAAPAVPLPGARGPLLL
jgi:hypothetical protein